MTFWSEEAARAALDAAFLAHVVQRANRRAREESAAIVPWTMSDSPDLYVPASTEISIAVVMTRQGRALYGPALGLPEGDE